MNTVHAALGITRSPRRRRRGAVNLSNQPQEDKPAPPPPSEALERWTSEHPYRYFNQETPQGTLEDAWEKCNEVLEGHDENICKDLKDEITFLMVVAGLFLAIVTAFTIESYKLLQENKEDTMSNLLVEVVRLLNDTSTQGQAQLPKRFTPDHRHIVVNQLWFLSMILSLVAVLLGTFCLQWISAFLRGTDLRDKSSSPPAAIAMRHLRFHGFDGWGVRHAPEALLLIVQLSIALFTSGLVYFLWNVDPIAAIPTLVIAGITGALLYLANLMPFLQPLVGVFYPKFLTCQCPYKSPTSWLVRAACDMLALTLRPFWRVFLHGNGVVHRFGIWLRASHMPLTDYLWRAHDASFIYYQDQWGVRSLLRSFGLGLSSALDILVLEPGAVDITRQYIQRLRRAPNIANNLREVFDQPLSDPEELVLNGRTNTFYSDGLAVNPADHQTSFDELQDDFTSALMFQNLLYRSEKLRRILLRHRVELYVRIRNSILFIFGRNPPYFVHKFGISLVCPLDGFEVEELDLELKFQFLDCLNRFWGTVFTMSTRDFIAAAEIIRREGIESPVSASGVPEVARPDSGDHDTYGKRGEADGYGSFSGIQRTGFKTEESPGESVCLGQQESGIHKVTDTKEDAPLDAASYVSDVHGMDRRDSGGLDTDGKKEKGDGYITAGENLHGSIQQSSGIHKTDVTSSVGDILEVDRLVPGDYDTDGKNGVRNDYNNLSGAQHTPAGVDHKTPRSNQHGINGKRVEDAQLRASFKRLCLQVEERLLGSPEPSFPHQDAFYGVRAILRPSHPSLPYNPRMATSPA